MKRRPSKPAKRPTAKEKVRKHWPYARSCYTCRLGYVIHPTGDSYRVIGEGIDDPAAWSDAARRLGERRKP